MNTINLQTILYKPLPCEVTVTSDASEKKQEVRVTDIRMPFGSMVLFMVKWAVASIPALIILVVLGALFWGVAIGFLSSIRTTPGRQVVSGEVTSGKSLGTAGPAASGDVAKSAAVEAEGQAYISKVRVSHVHVAQNALGETGAFGEIKNSGDRTLKSVEITVYCLNSEGKAIFETTYHPVLEGSFGDANQPLKPGYIRPFGVKMDGAPSDWAKKVDVKVTRVEFQ